MRLWMRRTTFSTASHSAKPRKSQSDPLRFRDQSMRGTIRPEFHGQENQSPPQPPTSKKHFDVQNFLESAGIARKVTEFKKNQIIFSQGDSGKTVLYIQKGGVRLSVVNERGKEAVIAMLAPGDFFGEGCLAGQPLRIGTATALSVTTIMIIEKREMSRVLHAEHAFSDRFIAHMLCSQYSSGRRSRRSAFQFQRETPGPRAFDARPVRQGGSARKSGAENFAGSSRGDGGHHLLSGEFLHEQISQAWFDQLQRQGIGDQ